MRADASDQKMVIAWLEEVGIGHAVGGVEGPALDWALSMPFGGTTHVSVVHDARYPRRLEVMSDLAIAADHKASYARLTKPERAKLDRALLEVILRRARLSFHIQRDEHGSPERILLRGHLPIEGLTPLALVETILDARNCTMELCVAFQDAFGDGSGHPLDKALTDPGYANVVLHRGTIETLGAFQIAGETLDETILRAVRE